MSFLHDAYSSFCAIGNCSTIPIKTEEIVAYIKLALKTSFSMKEIYNRKTVRREVSMGRKED